MARRSLSQNVAVAGTTLAPPDAVHAIPTGSARISGANNVVVRDVGCTRRVFLLDPHMRSEEIEGLAYRIDMMTRNDSLNSIFIASSYNDDAASGAIASSAIEMEKYGGDVLGYESSSPHGTIEPIAGGYDPIEVYKSGSYQDNASVQRLMDAVSGLALATRGNAATTRVPVITLPNGRVHDGGYALCMGGYVLATQDSSFSCRNPSRGLSFDPIGLSFILPRLGWEFQQVSADYAGCGLILALTGMEANASDMMETGLATHYIDSASSIGSIERGLAELPPWNQQNLLRNRPRFYGQPERSNDPNASFRNVSVANLIHSFTSYSASGADMFTARGVSDFDSYGDDDPSVNLDYTPLYADRDSVLVNYAATFDKFFREERTIADVAERFGEVAGRDALHEESRAGIAVAKDILNRMQQQSPLALSVIYSLMQEGSQKGESLESCIMREKHAQVKMFQGSDFEEWAKRAASGRCGFGAWQHKSLADVSQDQVKEIIGI